MFQPGELIVYGSNGICRVIEVGRLENSVLGSERIYYTLQPVYGTETIYIPVDTTIFMRPALSKEQAEHLIKQIPSIGENICMDSKQTVLKEHYEAAFESYKCEDLVQLIKGVYSKNLQAQEQGKKVGQLDQRYMSKAEDLLHGELAAALGIERDEVVQYIEQVVSVG